MNKFKTRKTIGVVIDRHGKILKNIRSILRRFIHHNKLFLIIYIESFKIKAVEKLWKNKRIHLVYDLKVSPPTFGDFTWILMVARYLLARRRDVRLYVIIGEYRVDWETLNGYLSINECIKVFKNLTEAYICDNKCNYYFCTWLEYLEMCNSDSYTIFNTNTKLRKPQYQYNSTLLSYLIGSNSRIILNKTLLTKDNFRYSNNVRIQLKEYGKYIAWPCRYNLNWNPERNISKKQFLKIYNILSEAFKGFNIIVVSDEIGCNFYKGIINNSNIFFSKDISNNLVDDIAIIINASFLFQFRSGGVGATQTFVPYVSIIEHMNGLMYGKNKFRSWALNTQLMVNSTTLPEKNQLLGMFNSSGVIL